MKTKQISGSTKPAPSESRAAELKVGLGFLAQTALSDSLSVKKFRKRMMVGKFHLNGQIRLESTLPAAKKVKFPRRRLKSLDSFESLVARRVSSRAFLNKPLSFESLGILLETSMASSISKAGDIDCCGLSLWVRRVQGLKDGFYIYDENEGCLQVATPVSKAPWEHDYLPKNSRVFICLRARPEKLISAYGPRGWRFLWMTAGSIWAHLYLAAADLGIGCCGVGGSTERVGLAQGERGVVAPIAFIVFGRI